MTTQEIIQRRPEYSITWEDPQVLLNSVNTATIDRVLIIENAGECAFSFLNTNAKEVVALIVDPAQSYIVELKKAAIQSFERDDCLEFLGFEDCSVRLLMYQHLEDKISNEAKEYWAEHLSYIDLGIIHCGKFEQNLKLFSTKVLPIIHSHKTTSQLFERKSSIEQKEFYNNIWKSRLWKLFFTLYFSKTSFGKHLHFDEFTKQNRKNFSQEIYELAENHLSSTQAQENEFLHYMFTGEFGLNTPYFLLEENYEMVKKNLSKLKIVQSSVIDFMKKDAHFTTIHLGDYIETLSNEEFIHFAKEFSHLSKKPTQLTHWNILSNHCFSEINPDKFKREIERSKSINANDKCFFHTRFNIETYI